MTERFQSPQLAGAWCRRERAAGHRLALVPTMGALHEGHLALVQEAKAENDAVCVSIFVNPLQFDDPRDLAAYPRNFERDVELLQGAGASAAFTGTLAEFFPSELDSAGKLAADAYVDPGPAALGLEGQCRSGHFAGVATIVDRLFEVTGVDVAYFGQKDYQQTLVVRHVAQQRGGPRIVVGRTVRAADGLALSSRNVRLSADERARALAIPRALQAARAAWSEGERRPQVLAELLAAELAQADLEVEYATVRDAENWTAEPPTADLQQAVALIAARVGAVRLIDNRILSE